MGSRHAIGAVLAHWLLQHRPNNAMQSEGRAFRGLTISTTIAAVRALEAAASMPA
jgi:hypothetical protein